MAVMELTNSDMLIELDDVDYEWASQWNWQLSGRGYVYRSLKRNVNVCLHIEILKRMGFDMSNKEGDHIDRDKNNYRRSNLRPCTTTQNLCNKDKQCNNTSGYKGVIWFERDKCWVAQIQHKKRLIRVFGFKTAEAAARKRDELTKQYQGKFGKLNFPD